MQLSFLVLSLIGSLFVCSFSSILSALMLVLSTFFVIFIMYWNLISSIPLYIFSLSMLGGLYVLIGFVMMADVDDLNMVMSSKKVKEFFLAFFSIFMSLSFSRFNMKMLDLDLISFSPIGVNDWVVWGVNSSTFIFLILILFIFLFILHSLMKSSMGGGGFVK